MTTNVADIRDKLIAKQKEAGLSDVAFAKKIGVSRQLWAFVKKGTRKPGMKFLKAVIKAFPDLQIYVYQIMAGSDDNSRKEGQNDNSSN